MQGAVLFRRLIALMWVMRGDAITSVMTRRQVITASNTMQMEDVKEISTHIELGHIPR